MVKRIKKRVQGLDTRTMELYDALVDATANSPDLNQVFECFMNLDEHRRLGKPADPGNFTDLLRMVGQGGIGGMVLGEPIQIMPMVNERPPLVHGMALFDGGQTMCTFFFLPQLLKGVAARVEGFTMHYQRFTMTVLPPGVSAVPGNKTVH